MLDVENVAKFVKDAIADLMGGSDAVWNLKVKTDGFGRTWAIVIGWNNGFEREDDPSRYCDRKDPSWHICYKTAFNDSSLQCDYAMDWLQPWGEDGEVDDDDTDFNRLDTDEDYRAIAKYLIASANRKVADWEDIQCK